MMQELASRIQSLNSYGMLLSGSGGEPALYGTEHPPGTWVSRSRQMPRCGAFQHGAQKQHHTLSPRAHRNLSVPPALNDKHAPHPTLPVTRCIGCPLVQHFNPELLKRYAMETNSAPGSILLYKRFYRNLNSQNGCSEPQK